MRGRLAGADDRGGCVFEDAVRLPDLDLGAAGVGERLLELRAGEGTCDAAGPLLHVGAGWRRPFLVGDHVGDREAGRRRTARARPRRAPRACRRAGVISPISAAGAVLHSPARLDLVAGWNNR